MHQAWRIGKSAGLSCASAGETEVLKRPVMRNAMDSHDMMYSAYVGMEYQAE